jgi:hypothetical protein
MRTIFWAALGAGLSLLACAAREAPPPAAAPEKPEEAEPAPPPAPGFASPPPGAEQESAPRNLEARDEDSLATAEAEFEQARVELYAALAPTRSDQPAAGAAPKAARPTKPSDSASGAAEAPKGDAEKKSSEGGCATACRAFASLGRAAEAVCRLAGEKDERCTRAKGIVSDAERKVASCACRSP